MFGSIFNSGDDGGDDIEDDLEKGEYDPETHSIHGEKYEIEPTGEFVREGGRITKVEVEITNDEGEIEKEIVAGPHIRRLIEGKYDDLGEWVLLGYQEDMQDGFTVAKNPYDTQFMHTWESGTTGSGKSKQKAGIMLQRAYNGDGFAFFDPKGDDAKEVIRRLPKSRKDDVIWIEPGDSQHEKSIGINPLAVPVDHDAPDEEISNEVESRLSLLKAALEAKGELHATMEAVTETLGRTMMYANVDPDKPNYSIIDMYFILLGQERRKAFAEECSDPFIGEFLDEIAEMEDDDLRPLLKRIKAWVENAVVRRVIACRDPSIDFDTIIDENKLVFVKTGLSDSDDVKKLTTMGVWREISSAKFRASDDPDRSPDPYFMYGDEFDSIVSEQLDLNNLFARSRSKELGLTVALQYPSQLSDGEQKPLKNNTNTSLFFKTQDEDDARVLMGRFRGMDADDLTDTDRYHAWTELENKAGQSSAPLKLKTWPPMPPLRSAEVVEEWIEDSLEKYGDDQLTDEQIQRELQFGHISEAVDGFTASDESRMAAAKAVYDYGEVHGIDTTQEYVDVADVADTIRWYVGYETGMTDAQIEESLGGDNQLYSELLQRVPALDETDGSDGGTAVKVDPNTVSDIKAVGTGSSDGKGTHARLIRALYDKLAPRGAHVEVLEQGSGSMPDGRITATPHADDLVLYLCGGVGESAPIEAEKSTGDDKPGQTVINGAGAANDGKHCVFTARPKEAPRVWNTLAVDPIYKSERDGDVTTLFNSTSEVRVDGDLAYRDGSRNSVWLHDESTGEYILKDDSGTEHARFNSAAGVGRNAEAYEAVGGEHDDLRTIRSPVIPEQVFEGDPPEPDEEAWSLLVVDDGEVGVYRPDDDPAPLDSLLDDGTDDADQETTPDPGAPDPDDLETNTRAPELLRVIHEAVGRGGMITKSQAEEEANRLDDEYDAAASRQSINNWMNELEEMGALESAWTDENNATVYKVR